MYKLTLVRSSIFQLSSYLFFLCNAIHESQGSNLAVLASEADRIVDFTHLFFYN